MKYFDELKRSMEFLAQDPRTVFMGQAVAVAGTAMTNTLKDIPRDRLIELPDPLQGLRAVTIHLGILRIGIECKPEVA